MSTLARLFFWVPPDRMDDFERIYRKQLVPILQKHEVGESSERGRRTVERVSSRRFEVKTPLEVGRDRSMWLSHSASKEASR